uniref:Uncharacterized protein n=1 Tax=Amphiprion percula TaxID=161767 RepID=A0A3P8T9D8_AMPPE
MFEGCCFQTNIYGTFHSHKNRKHNLHTLKDFKPGVVTTTQVSQDSPDDPEEDAQNQDDGVVEADGGCSSHDADDENTAAAMAETVYGIYVIRHSGAEPSDAPEDVGIILEGVTVLSELRNVPFALSILLAFVYNLNLSYPPDLKYTFEALQKIILELDGNRLSAKVQALKTVLSH